MVKKTELNVFSGTEPKPQSPPRDDYDLDDGVIQASGIGLRKGELDALKAIAEAHGVKRNAVMRFAMRWFIKQYRAGKVDLERFAELPPPKEKKLRMP